MSVPILLLASFLSLRLRVEDVTLFVICVLYFLLWILIISVLFQLVLQEPEDHALLFLRNLFWAHLRQKLLSPGTIKVTLLHFILPVFALLTSLGYLFHF